VDTLSSERSTLRHGDSGRRDIFMATLGQELHRLRSLKGLSPGDVVEKAGKKFSYEYLYRIERDKVKKPSPHVLHELSVIYGASYPGLMKLAGFVVPGSSPQASSTSACVAFDALNLTEEERNEVMDFVEFLRTKKKC
jgi:transcriptional regulator with XRE-family HTH domain